MSTGWRTIPSLANAPEAAVIEMRVTSPAPSASDGTLGGVPTFSLLRVAHRVRDADGAEHRTAARLLDVRSAVRSVIESALECSSSGTAAACGVAIGSFSPLMTVAGE